MSLLMDALRKAEQQKQKLAAQGPGSADAQPPQGLSLEPVQFDMPEPALAPPAEVPPENDATGSPASLLGRSSRSRLPELPTRLEDLDEQFMAHVAEPPPRKPAAAAAAPPPPTPASPPPTSAAPAPAHAAPEGKLEPSPESARKLFEAKQSPQPNKRKFALAIGAVALLAGIGIGGYVWWELQPKGGMVAGNLAKAPVPAPPPVSAPAPVAAPAAAPPVAAPAASAPPAPPPIESVASVSPAPPASVPVEKQRDSGRPATNASDDDDEKPKAETARRATTPAAAAPPPVPRTESQVRVSAATRKQDPALDQAYQAFNQGEFDLAQASWKKVLAKDPRNADALHGMAALALQGQKHDLAAEYYSRALENDPKDARALSGLLALKGPAGGIQAESRLKLLLAEQPDSPYLNFALGNLLARDTRWAEAQQAYFKAHTADPANPDYLFNLAVSLDQLHQPRLAAQYYSQALAAAAQQPAGFDAIQVATRLKALQSALQQ